MTEGNRKIENIAESFNTVEIPAEVDLVIEKAIQRGKRHRTNLRKTFGIVAAMLVICTFAGLSASGILGKSDSNSKKVVTNTSIGELPKVDSFDNLKKLLAASTQNSVKYKGTEDVAQGNSSAGKTSAPASGNGAGYSNTNLQVQGVDEGDIVKTDGEFIYKVRVNNNGSWNSGFVDIVKAYPAQAASKVATINVKGYPSDLYIKGNYLVILYNGPYDVIDNRTDSIAPYGRQAATSIEIVDIKDKANPKVRREVSIEGNMISSRLIENRLYLITNKYINTAVIDNKELREQILPSYRDSNNKGSETLSLDKIGYCPEVVAPNYVIAASLNLDNLDEKLKLTANLGSGSQVYCSDKNLYVAGYNIKQTKAADKAEAVKGKLGAFEQNTSIYKFNLKEGEVVFQTSAEIPGSIINQFSMDELGDEFRIAATRSYPDASNKLVTDNNLYVLDGNMKLKGKIENIAAGERIYSTRFMGNRAYMVTFRTVDPLFVIDLSDGSNPKILGQLKIPGFSSYLHPYDENHIIGFGMDTEVVGTGTGGEIAKAKGLKIAMFDVSDVNNPKQEFVTSIGDRGTYSEALYNHKALLFDKEKELLALPVDVVQQDRSKANSMGFYQAAYIYKVNLTEGFKLLGTINHSESDGRGTQYSSYKWDNHIQRILYIGDYIYTISNNKLMIHGIKDLSKAGEISY